ncbi:hypothetical protein JCM10207_006292 [Rhodosporidiobolus poonsookiae]
MEFSNLLHPQGSSNGPATPVATGSALPSSGDLQEQLASYGSRDQTMATSGLGSTANAYPLNLQPGNAATEAGQLPPPIPSGGAPFLASHAQPGAETALAGMSSVAQSYDALGGPANGVVELAGGVPPSTILNAGTSNGLPVPAAALAISPLDLQLPVPALSAALPAGRAESVVPDSDEDEARKMQDGPGRVVKEEQDSEEMDVDVMGGVDERVTLAALKALSPSSTSSVPPTKPRARPPSAKPKSRATHFSSGGTSPAPSPGPSSSLAHEVLPSSFHAESSSSALPPTTASLPSHPAFAYLHSPSSYVHPSLSDPTRARLPAAFESYAPPKTNKLGESDDEEDEAERRRERARKAAQSAARERERRGKRGKEKRGDGDEEDDRLYCICQELYNPERMMIACDKCEEWYHVDCVGIAEDRVELVDLFICPKCQATSLDRTTWKPPCKRPHCRSPAVVLSKYCSTYCGLLVLSSRLSLLQDATGLAPEEFYPSVRDATPRQSAVTDQSVEGADARAFLTLEQRRSKVRKEWDAEDAQDARERRRLEVRLEETERRRRALEDKVLLVQRRVDYLAVAVRRWEALCQATADEMQQAGIDIATAVAAGGGRRRGGGGGNKKKKGPVSATSLPDAQCGLDVRLVYDAAAWAAWVADPGPEGGRAILEAKERGEEERVLEMALGTIEGVCLETRKKCERHTGWQKVREADFHVEKAVLQRRLHRLTSLAESLEHQLATHDTAVTFRQSVRLSGSSADPDRLIDVADYIHEREAAAGRGRRGSAQGSVNGGGGGGGRGARGISPELGGGDGAADDSGDEYEIPAEVLPFLSRAEIARLKATKGRG